MGNMDVGHSLASIFARYHLGHVNALVTQQNDRRQHWLWSWVQEGKIFRPQFFWAGGSFVHDPSVHTVVKEVDRVV